MNPALLELSNPPASVAGSSGRADGHGRCRGGGLGSVLAHPACQKGWGPPGTRSPPRLLSSGDSGSRARPDPVSEP